MRRKIFFTSDWHCFHDNCLLFDKRPFEDIDHMHRTLIKRFNNTVPSKGITYFLGDMGFNSGESLKKIIDQLNGTKILIRGNHDKGFNAMYEAGFDVVTDKAQIMVGKNIVTMSHCPLNGVFREDVRRMKGIIKGDHWHKEYKHKNIYSFNDFGQFHLSGHIHSPNNGKSIQKLVRQFDVGVVSNQYAPVTLSQIESWICKTKPLLEDWRDVIGFNGYKVNRLGEVKSFRRYPEGKFLSPYMDKDGYLCLSMRVNGKSKAEKLHRAVAKAFIDNPDSLAQVNHKNGHKLDCSVSNLEWSSNIDNQRHAWDNELKFIKLKKEDVRQIKRMISEGLENTTISKIFDVDPSTISNIRTGRIWKRIEINEK